MAADTVERRLAAIMFTDIVGYTVLMAESEEKGLRVRARYREFVRPLVERYHGESIEARGDEPLSVFSTALDAVNCALAIQSEVNRDPLFLRGLLCPTLYNYEMRESCRDPARSQGGRCLPSSYNRPRRHEGYNEPWRSPDES